MPFDVTMPKLTDSMEEGRIVEWKVAPGDRVREGDVLAEIETDKAVMELESFWIGAVAEILRGNGDVAAVGEVIARIGEAGEGDEVRRAREAGGGPEAREAAERSPGEGEAASRREAAAPRPESGGPRPQAERRGEAPEPRTRADEEPAAAGKAAGAAGEFRVVPLPGAHPLSERGGVESPRPAPPPRVAERAEPGAAGGLSEAVKASPRARKLAREKGLELAEVQGTGAEGRVTSADVEAAAAKGGQPRRSAAADRPDEGLPPVTFAEGDAEPEEVSFFQKAAIRRIAASARMVPHFFISAAVRAESLLERKEAAGAGVTLTHLILRASALALEAFPDANRSYDRGRWIRWKVVNLGVAVQTEAGLVVAVLRGAQGKDLPWLAERTRGLVERARAGRLKPDERANATFTLSNLGPYAVERFTAIPNPPSALTLAAGSVLEEAVVSGGRLEAGRVMHLTLSCDHRVVDGVLAARFLGAVKGLLENPGDL